MSKFDLGLEALADQSAFEMTGDILSYEYLDTVIQFNDEAAEAVVIADGIGAIAGAMENLGAICEVLKEHGNSPALEALVGSNFKEGFSLEAAENAKEGLWARFVKWLKSLWAKIKAFFAKYFVSAEAMERSLRARAQEIANNDMKEITVTLPKPSVLKDINKDIVDRLTAALNECAADVKAADGSNLFDEQYKASKDASSELGLLEKHFGTEGASVTVTKQDGLDLLNEIADHLKALGGCKRAIDGIASDLNKESFGITKADSDAAYKEAKGKSNTAAAKEKGEAARAKSEYKGSGERRNEIMRRHSEVTKFLNKATKKAIKDGSYALSVFKVAKVTK